MSLLSKAEKEFEEVLSDDGEKYGEDEWNLGAGLASTGMKLVKKLKKIKRIAEDVKDSENKDDLWYALQEIKDLF